MPELSFPNKVKSIMRHYMRLSCIPISSLLDREHPDARSRNLEHRTPTPLAGRRAIHAGQHAGQRSETP